MHSTSKACSAIPSNNRFLEAGIPYMTNAGVGTPLRGSGML